MRFKRKFIEGLLDEANKQIDVITLIADKDEWSLQRVRKKNIIMIFTMVYLWYCKNY